MVFPLRSPPDGGGHIPVPGWRSLAASCSDQSPLTTHFGMRGIGHPVTTHVQCEGSDSLSRPSLLRGDSRASMRFAPFARPCAAQTRGFCSPLAASGGGVHHAPALALTQRQSRVDHSLFTTHLLSMFAERHRRASCHDPRLLPHIRAWFCIAARRLRRRATLRCAVLLRASPRGCPSMDTRSAERSMFAERHRRAHVPGR